VIVDIETQRENREILNGASVKTLPLFIFYRLVVPASLWGLKK